MKQVHWLLAAAAAGGISLAGCSGENVQGAAVGAGVAGAAYEYQSKRAMDRLDEDYRAGRIDRGEYERRKDQIRGGSLLQ